MFLHQFWRLIVHKPILLPVHLLRAIIESLFRSSIKVSLTPRHAEPKNDGVIWLSRAGRLPSAKVLLRLEKWTDIILFCIILWKTAPVGYYLHHPPSSQQPASHFPLSAFHSCLTSSLFCSVLADEDWPILDTKHSMFRMHCERS